LERSRAAAAGAGLGSAFRLLKNTDRNRRVLKASLAGVQAFARSLTRVVGQLWHEVTGFVFLCFAVFGGFATLREYHAYQAGTIGSGKVVLAGLFTAMFCYFGISNFARARRR
jgi:hypothetical protein